MRALTFRELDTYVMKSSGSSVISIKCPRKDHSFKVSINGPLKIELKNVCPKPNLIAYYYRNTVYMEYDAFNPMSEIRNSLMLGKTYKTYLVYLHSGESNEAYTKVIWFQTVLLYYILIYLKQYLSVQALL